MRIQCLTHFKDTDAGTPTDFYQDDVCSVSDEDGARFCANGWARDVSGETPTGATAQGATDLDIANVTSGHSSNTLGS